YCCPLHRFILLAASPSYTYAPCDFWTYVSCFVVFIFFFFKQKTAYEIGLGIPAEPLFRSNQTGKKFRVGIKSNISTNRNNLISGVDRCIHLNAMKKTTITSINRQTIKI